MPADLSFAFDTNVIVSALLLKQSAARQAFDKALEQGKLLVSQETAKELKDVLRRRGFDRYVLEDERMEFLTALVREATLVEVTQTVTECRDPKDNKFLELALSAKATYIATGDDDLLVMRPFRGIPILSPREFILQSWEDAAPDANSM